MTEDNKKGDVCQFMAVFVSSVQAQAETYMTQEEIELAFKVARRDKKDVRIRTRENDPSLKSQDVYVALDNLCFYVVRQKKESKILTLERPLVSGPGVQ